MEPPKNLHPTILLVEDDEDDQLLLIHAFAEADPNFHIHAVASGAQALEYIENEENERPCLIVLDYNMPGMNGVQVLRELNKRKRSNDIPKIIFSTSNNAKYMEESKKEGAKFYIVKPALYSSLIEKAKDMMSLCKSEH